MSESEAKRDQDALRVDLTLLWVPSVLGLLFVLVAVAHRLQLGNTGYTRSLLIPLEMILVVVLFLSIIIQLLASVVLLVRRRWRVLLVLIINILASTALTVAGMCIDAPTIIYMTEGPGGQYTSLRLTPLPPSLHAGHIRVSTEHGPSLESAWAI